MHKICQICKKIMSYIVQTSELTWRIRAHLTDNSNHSYTIQLLNKRCETLRYPCVTSGERYQWITVILYLFLNLKQLLHDSKCLLSRRPRCVIFLFFYFISEVIFMKLICISWSNYLFYFFCWVFCLGKLRWRRDKMWNIVVMLKGGRHFKNYGFLFVFR